jgi:hypothetical protein
MSQEIDLCRDTGDDNRVRPNTASVPPFPLTRKRAREIKEFFIGAHPRNENGPKNKTATVAAESVVDLELADEVEAVSPHKKRRGVRKSKPSGKNDAAGKCAQNLKGDHAAENDVGSEGAQVADHRESHEGIAAAASQPMNSDSEQTSRNYGPANKHSRKLSTSKPASNASGRQERVAWEYRLSELADFRKNNGHCNVPQRYSENTKLGGWVSNQRTNYRLHLEGKKSSMTTFRIQELEGLGFEWDYSSATWEDRLSELADYRKINGHCNVPRIYSANAKLGTWVAAQRTQYRLHLKGKESSMTLSQIQELESLGFERGWCNTAWGDRFRELADYSKIHGHCNIPERYSENSKLAKWVATQRYNYKLHVKGKTSYITLSRIQELESLGFEWDSQGAVWEDHMSALADYRKIHGHCNVPQGYNAKLANWVGKQRYQYKLHLEGKRSPMNLLRIQALDSLGFEWPTGPVKGTRETPSLDDDMRRVNKKPANSRQGANYQLETAPSTVILRATVYY